MGSARRKVSKNAARVWVVGPSGRSPWPDLTELRGHPPYLWSLDGGGRHLVVDLINRTKPTSFLEVGCFLGGSALTWLRSASDFTLIVVDTWDRYAAEWLFRCAETPPPWVQDPAALEPLVRPVKTYGLMNIALNNLRDFKDRVIPLNMRAEEAYRYIAKFVEPDIVYIDAAKEWPEFLLAHETFPNAILCGDDWEWTDDDGEFRVRPFVWDIAERRGCSVETQQIEPLGYYQNKQT